MKRLSEMTDDELYAEMQRLLGEQRKKEQAGFVSEANVLEQRYFMAKSYRLDPATFTKGEQYRVAGEQGLFTIDYLNGVFAWGKVDGETEQRAFPIGRLETIDQVLESDN